MHGYNNICYGSFCQAILFLTALSGISFSFFHFHLSWGQKKFSALCYVIFFATEIVHIEQLSLVGLGFGWQSLF